MPDTQTVRIRYEMLVTEVCDGEGFVETERDDPESTHGVSVGRVPCPRCAEVAATDG